MELSNYLSNVLANFTDSRTVKNVTALVQNIIEHNSVRLWSISSDKAEFERSKRLLDGSLQTVLDAEKSSEALRERSVAALAAETRLIVLHDPCDIRKKYAKLLENMGKVRDLDGNIINGYSTFATVALSVTGKQLHPVDVTVYSNGDDHYVTVAELKKFKKGKLQKSQDEAERERARQITQFVEEKSYLNLPRLTRTQLQRVSEAFKAAQPERSLCHVLDRQFDGVDYFEFIAQELADEFVIRAKISRNSNVETLDPETGKTRALKLKTVKLSAEQTFVIDKLQIKQKVYQDAKCVLAWGTLTLRGQVYTVVRVTLLDRQGKPIYANPLLLITNIAVQKAAPAREIYRIYLLRAKIEAVFKFFKDVLGWEEFQVRDYESIQNLLALAYFVGGYFYEIGSDLTENPTIALIAQLGGGKGQVTRYYFLQGLRKLLTYGSLNKFVKEHAIDAETLGKMLAFVT